VRNPPRGEKAFKTTQNALRPVSEIRLTRSRNGGKEKETPARWGKREGKLPAN